MNYRRPSKNNPKHKRNFLKRFSDSTWFVESLLIISFACAGFYLFYSSPMRDKLENQLGDFSTRLIQHNSDFKNTLIVDTSPLLNDARNQHQFYENLSSLADRILALNPKIILFALEPPYEQDLLPIVEFCKKNPSALLGVYDLNASHIALQRIPPVLQRIIENVVSIDPQNYARMRAARSFPLLDLNPIDKGNYIAARVLGLNDRKQIIDTVGSNQLIQHRMSDQQSLHFRINYSRMGSVPFVQATSSAQGWNFKESDVKDKILILSSLSYHPVSASNPIPNYANTPFQGDGSPLERAEPVAKIIATAVENILSRSWIKTLSSQNHIFFCIVVFIVTIAIWWLKTTTALFFLALIWLMLIFTNGVLGSWYFFRFPLSEALALSILYSVGAGTWRIRREVYVLQKQQAQLSSDIEIDKLQDRYLDELNSNLQSRNTILRSKLDQLKLPMDDAKVKTFYNAAIASSEELDEFLKGVKSVSEIMLQSSQKDFKVHERINLHEFIEGQFLKATNTLNSKQITLINQIPKNISIICPRWILEQILHNLFSNSANYCPPNSKIAVNILNQSPLVLAVKDNGPGIPTSERDKVFEKFYRIRTDRSYETKGHGLGLYLSRFFAKAIGGDLKLVDPPEGASEFTGAHFEVSLPSSAPTDIEPTQNAGEVS